MGALLDPKTGLTIGYRETKGTTAEPFFVPMAWQASTLSYVSLTLDAAGNLNVTGGSGSGGAVTVADGADVAEGFTTDTAVFGDVSGTVSAKLRGINAMVRGIGTAQSPATANITNSDSVAVSANASRKKLVIVNLGTTNIFFGDGQPAVLNSGLTLTPGGTWVMSHNTFSTAAIHAICATTAILAIQEYA